MWIDSSAYQQPLRDTGLLPSEYAALTIRVQVFVRTHFCSSGHIPGSGLAGSGGRCVVDLEEPPSVLHSSCTTFHPHQQNEGCSFSTSSPAGGVWRSPARAGASHRGCDWHFPEGLSAHARRGHLHASCGGGIGASCLACRTHPCVYFSLGGPSFWELYSPFFEKQPALLSALPS